MFCKLPFLSNHSRQRLEILFLSLFWLLGFCAGAFWGWNDRASFSKFISELSFNHTTVLFKFGFFVATLLFSIVGFVLKFRFLFYAAAVAEGIAYGAVVIGLASLDSSGGWLLTSLLLFPTFLFLIPKLWLWVECFDKSFSDIIFSLLVIIACYIPALAIWNKWIKPIVVVLLEFF